MTFWIAMRDTRSSLWVIPNERYADRALAEHFRPRAYGQLWPSVIIEAMDFESAAQELQRLQTAGDLERWQNR